MRTREKLRVPVKVKCSGCSVKREVANAAVEPGTRVMLRCKSCGKAREYAITEAMIKEAIAEYQENKEFAKRLKAGQVKTIPDPRPTGLAPARTTTCAVKVAADASFGGTRREGRVASKEVRGAAKLYHYAVYVRHPWGTDRIVVGVKKRNIQAARDEAWDRVVNKRKTADLKIMDAVPMKWTPNGIVETRRTTIKTGEYRNQRRPKSRPSVRQRKAPAYTPRNKKNDD